MSIILAIYSEWALLVLRMFVGALFMVHGIPKLRDLKGTAKWMGAAGFRPGMLSATVVGVLESVGGALFILGVLVRPVAPLFVLEFAVILVWRALIKKDSFIGSKGAGWELDLVLFGAVLVLMTSGGGAWQLF